MTRIGTPSRTAQTRQKSVAGMLNHRPLAPGNDPEILGGGAGAVGLVLGIALARAGRRVTLIEGGPATPPADCIARNHGPYSGVALLGLAEGRMKARGGTTRLWGGQRVPFGPSDFRPTYPGKPAWPIDHETLAPWFDRAFDFLGVAEAARDPAGVWRRVGGAPIDLGPSLAATMNIWLPAADFTKLFATDIAGLPTLRIVTDMEATARDFAADGRVAAVRAQARDGSPHRLAAPQVVLANGTMEIARLLLRAAATATACPFAGNAHIGRGFIDHLHGIVGRVEGGDVTKLRAGFENILLDGRKYSVKIRASDDLLERHGIANCAATFNANGSIRQAIGDVRDLFRRVFAKGDWRHMGTTLVEAGRTARMLAPILWTYLVRRRSHSLFDRGILLGLVIEQIPVAESRLFLDPAAPPETAAVGVHWAFDGRELEAADLFCAELARSFAERGLGTITLDPRIAARDPALFADLHDAFHHMGGARMAENAGKGVVDRDLRVFGCGNLSVLGAATFPSGSFANPTLTAIALALRLAERRDRDMGAASCCSSASCSDAATLPGALPRANRASCSTMPAPPASAISTPRRPMASARPRMSSGKSSATITRSRSPPASCVACRATRCCCSKAMPRRRHRTSSPFSNICSRKAARVMSVSPMARSTTLPCAPPARRIGPCRRRSIRRCCSRRSPCPTRRPSCTRWSRPMAGCGGATRVMRGPPSKRSTPSHHSRRARRSRSCCPTASPRETSRR